MRREEYGRGVCGGWLFHVSSFMGVMQVADSVIANIRCLVDIVK